MKPLFFKKNMNAIQHNSSLFSVASSLFFFLGMCFLGLYSAYPQQTDVSESPAAPFPVSLQTVLEEVLTNNPDIIRARLDWMAEKRKLISSWGSFEPEWVGSYTRGGFQKSTSRFLTETKEYQAGVEGRVPTGGTYRAEFNLTDQNYSNYTTTRPRAFSGVSFTQPLLRGAWFGAPWSEVRLSAIDKNIAYSQYRAELMKIIGDVESAYFSLAFAEERYRFATESADVAEKLVQDAKARRLAGKLSVMGVVEAEAGWAQRRSEQSLRKRELWEAMNQLKLIVSSKKLGAVPVKYKKGTLTRDEEESIK
jgi:outer membrane protein TolC